jgi:hypothetical protein
VNYKLAFFKISPPQKIFLPPRWGGEVRGGDKFSGGVKYEIRNLALLEENLVLLEEKRAF